MQQPLFMTNQESLTEASRRLNRWVMESRRSLDTWLISKGCILKPPFEIKTNIEKDLVNLRLSGQSGIFEVKLNKVVDSPFRDQIGLFLVDAKGVVQESHTLAPLAKHMQTILEAFPPGSRFGTEELYAKITWSEDSTRSQAHARRRWKELKYSYGFDLDCDGRTYWRGSSAVPINEPALRPDDKKLRQRFWPTLADESSKFNNDDLPHCAYCGCRVVSRDEYTRDIQFDDIGLIDHRRPVFQAGDDSRENLQILCQTCNNLKNRICRQCPFHFQCSICIWAYPEKSKSKRLVLRLDPELFEALSARCKGNDLEGMAIAILKDAFHYPNSGFRQEKT